MTRLQNFLRGERPPNDSQYVFVSLKGRQRSNPMTPAGLRSLFRHHRRKTTIMKANPHRFRHTFGADMIRAGVSLPALMRLMGHSQIHTTMLTTVATRCLARVSSGCVEVKTPWTSQESMSINQQPCELVQIFELQLQTLAASLRPATIRYYRVQANRFLRFLRAKYPEILTADQLRRNPHLLGWLHSMAEFAA
jgi:hypothetical protein